MIFMFTRSYTIQCKQSDPDAGFITNRIFLRLKNILKNLQHIVILWCFICWPEDGSMPKHVVFIIKYSTIKPPFVQLCCVKRKNILLLLLLLQYTAGWKPTVLIF
jgi:hypothetical protein